MTKAKEKKAQPKMSSSVAKWTLREVNAYIRGLERNNEALNEIIVSIIKAYKTREELLEERKYIREALEDIGLDHGLKKKDCYYKEDLPCKLCD